MVASPPPSPPPSVAPAPPTPLAPATSRMHDAVPPAPVRSNAAILGPAEPEPEPQDYDAFAHEPPFRPRRNRARLWTALAVAAALLMLAATAAIWWYGLPRSGGTLSIGSSSATSLTIEGKGKREQMASGNELLQVTGQITNPTDQVQRVPPIRGKLLDGQRRVVYTWPISPPVAELQPGATVSFNSAEVDVPRGATALNLSFGPAT